MVTGWIVTTTGFCGEHNFKKNIMLHLIAAVNVA
jgi:hypothetical protein